MQASKAIPKAKLVGSGIRVLGIRASFVMGHSSFGFQSFPWLDWTAGIGMLASWPKVDRTRSSLQRTEACYWPQAAVSRARPRSLCRADWYPLDCFARRLGYGPQDAQD